MLTEAVNSIITTLFCIVLKSLTIPPGGRFSCWGGGGGSSGWGVVELVVPGIGKIFNL